MASNAVLSENRVSEPFRHTQIMIDQALQTLPRVVTRRDEVTEPIDLNLRAGVKVNCRGGTDGAILDQLFAVVSAIKELENLAPGWDSYGAAALNDKAVAPALELTILAMHRCHVPSIVPLPTGGVGLRLKSAANELEIDVGPDGFCTGVLEYLEDGSTEEINEPSEVDALIALVNAFNRAG
jgi:hypothetical protein